MTRPALTPTQRHVLHRLAERQGSDGAAVAMSGTPRPGGGAYTPTRTLLALERRGLVHPIRTGRHIAAWRWGLTDNGRPMVFHLWPYLVNPTLAAYHEAGHAVAGVLLGVPVGPARMGADGCDVDWPDSGRYRPERCGWVERENMVTVYVAGKVAERKRCQQTGESELHGSDGQDQRDCIPLLLRLGPDQVDTMKRMKKRVQALFEAPEVWPAVERVAQALFGRGHLSASTIKRLAAPALVATRGVGDEPPNLQ